MLRGKLIPSAVSKFSISHWTYTATREKCNQWEQESRFKILAKLPVQVVVETPFNSRSYAEDVTSVTSGASQGPHSFNLVFVCLCVCLFVCLCHAWRYPYLTAKKHRML